MSKTSDGRPGAVSLEQLAALNDEIAALVRAGVPLESGLAQVGRDLPGQLGRVTERLAKKMEAGASLEEAIADEGAALPRVYRTMVRAGVRSGRLAVVLEELAETARRLAELRRNMGLALFYPVLVAALGIALFAFFVSNIAPNFADMDLPGSGILRAVSHLRHGAVWWGTLAPALLILSALAWWVVSRRASILDHRRNGRLLAWLPTMGKVRAYSRAASAAEMLRLLVEHDVPLDEAIRLAGEAGGDPVTADACGQIAARLAEGQPLDAATTPLRDLPPLLRAAVLCGDNQRRLVRSARLAAETYRDRAQTLLETSRLFLPVALTLVVGLTVTLAFALVTFVPYVQILHALAMP